MHPHRSLLFHFVAGLLLWVSLAACNSFNAPAMPTLSPPENRGRGIFDSYCTPCHAAAGETVVVGPSLAGIAVRGGNRIEGMDAQTYIRNSIVDPNVYIVEGFPEKIMPPDLNDQLSSKDLDALVAYLLTLR
jgi:mono/diheme cytochrome c family protein